MSENTTNYKILVVEENYDDFLFIQKKIVKRLALSNVVRAQNMHQAWIEISNAPFDIVILDITGLALSAADAVSEIAKLSDISKIIVISSYANPLLENELFHLGIGDFILKKKITYRAIHKSLVHAVQRSRMLASIRETQKQYDDLFHLSPLPMWIYNVETLRFRNVNGAAERKYGYTRKEFKKMTIRDIRPKEDIRILEKALEFVRSHDRLFASGIYRHQKKNGEILTVELVSNIIYLDGTKHEFVLANDITEQLHYIKAIEEKNKTLQEIAFTQSHIVRPPLANMMGILHLIKDVDLTSADGQQLLEHFVSCSKELDRSIHEIVQKASRK
ncbi:MAG: hypothetical protein BGO88_08465 [Flavobacterium sp. 38-13]|uniref:PAS domain S-box protein n=1 Tax=Flavobacterium sp. 38-13 TaxID=1896168 RepID=UPI0009617AFF|nr:PAS domain S-box protein [Flavobacterium sp. 38-13]OJX49779.1 MAG: hypothetical protein BGO88_08465 [Flavobacterium sp. 38-13]